MSIIFYYNANVIKLFVVAFLLAFINIAFAQDDPISQELKKQKQENLGANLKEAEAEELNHINTKYSITDKESELRSKQRSGQKIGFFDRIRIGRANRKDYMRTKKFEHFKEKVILNRQSEKTKTRMKENKKKADKKFKQEKRKKKKKSFFNLFK